MDKSIISIITVVLNAKNTIENTITSVLSQEKSLFEYWIIDGGSIDGTLDIIQKYESRLAGWISEPDKGIYDAMNKGIDCANGEWIYFLGADDILQKDILTKISDKLDKNLAVVFGNILFDNRHIMRSKLTYRTLLENTLHHQGAFYNKSLFQNFRYNTIFRVSSDYELNLYIYLNNLPFLHVNCIIAICGSEGISNIPNSKETNQIRNKYLGNTLTNFSLSCYLSLYYSLFIFKKKLKEKLKLL